MQGKSDNTDWDYEWSYLSGQLPQDERFIKSVTGEMTEQGLLLTKNNDGILMPDRDRLKLYMKFLYSSGKTNNLQRGLCVNFYNGATEPPIICFSEGQNNFSIPDWCVMWLGGNPHISYSSIYRRGEDNEALIEYDLTADVTAVCNVNGVDGRPQPSPGKIMWYYKKSLIFMKDSSEGMTCLIKELKFKLS